MPARKKDDVSVFIPKVETRIAHVHILGIKPLICHELPLRSKIELLCGGSGKNMAEKRNTVKHDVLQEFRDSINRAPDGSPTRIRVRSSAFKRGMANVAVDLPGPAKAQIGRLVWVEGEFVNVYGVPQLRMDTMSLQGINRSKDMRTRAILPAWCCELSITYVSPNINEENIANLLASAGIIQGIGDSRPEKGRGDYGQYVIVDADDKQWLAVKKSGGIKAQDAAFQKPEMYNEETRNIFETYLAEVKRRQFKVAK